MRFVIFGAGAIAHLEAGIVQAYATRVTGAIDIGRYPYGVDDRCAALCGALRAGRFDSQPREDIMRHKHALDRVDAG